MRKNDFEIRAAVLLVIAAAAFLLTSCAGTELNKTVFVNSMGISLKNNIYSVALFGNAAAKDGETDITAVGKGRTIAEAMSAARIDCGMELFLGHCDKIAANSAALRDSAMFAGFTDSIVSPACKVYFSDSPETGAENIPPEGFSAELYKLSACSKNGTPAVIPTAEDPNRAAVVTAAETILLDSEDSFGLMLLRGQAYPRIITAAVNGGFETVKISPSAHRRAYITDDGILTVEIQLALNAENCSEDAGKAVAGLSEKLCRRAFSKTVNTMGIDSINICSLANYTRSQLSNAQLILSVKNN